MIGSQTQIMHVRGGDVYEALCALGDVRHGDISIKRQLVEGQHVAQAEVVLCRRSENHQQVVLRSRFVRPTGSKPEDFSLQCLPTTGDLGGVARPQNPWRSPVTGMPE